MALVVPAYPELPPSDYERIQEFRKDHDRYYRVVKPHFTLVFPMPEEWEIEAFTAEIEERTRGIQPFGFTIRCASLNKDAFQELYHAFLVPDEGHSHIVKLFEKISSGKLFQYRHLDVDYLPHIGIGNSTDPLRCLEMVRQWNKQEFEIAGRVSMLDIADYNGEKVQTIKRIPLGG